MTDKKQLPKWTDERTSELVAIVGEELGTVSVDVVHQAAEALETTVRSIGSKLRKMGYEVESMTEARTKSFTEAEEAKLRAFVESNPGVYTYAEIATYVFDSPDLARKVQGKLLSMDLTSKVRKAPPKEHVKAYTDEEEATVLEMIQAGAYIEDIAAAVNKPVNSVRGKALSLNRSHGTAMPQQREKEVKIDALSELEGVAEMTVAEIAEAIGKTERGVKTMLTYRGITAKDYDGAARKEKLAEKKTA
jgi:predicted transcriptional regulator